MADNEKMMGDSSVQQGSSQDDKEITRPRTEAKHVVGGTGRGRDLGTAGGGTIPGSETPMRPSNAADDNSTVNDGDTSGDSNRDNETVSDREVLTHSDVAGNAIDKHARGNLGGRNPSQPQTAMGDRDTKRDRADRGEVQITDPMTSRDPSKINEDTPDNDDPGYKK
ncbi:MAG: hypothetical protein ACJ788_10560 [Ktedonobacteraceae bacterium]